MHKTHQDGEICETILAEYLIRAGYLVFRPSAVTGPVDIVAVHPDTGNVYLLDSKKDSKRLVPPRKTPTRIYRTLTKEQKKLGVRMAYVDMDTRAVVIHPPLD
jgi:hypothetical protein